MKIGIGVTTRNRPEVFELWVNYFTKFVPETSMFYPYSYNDASDKAYHYGFETHEKGTKRIGISSSKNKCLKALYEAECTHIFLFDDDCFPIIEEWWKPFIDSGCPHLNFIPINEKVDTRIINSRDGVVEVNNLWGCMIYLDVSQTGQVYYDEAYKIYGYEHCELSRRLHREGKSWFINATLPNITDILYSFDYHKNWLGIDPPLWKLEQPFMSSMAGEPAQEYAIKNAEIYDNT